MFRRVSIFTAALLLLGLIRLFPVPSVSAASQEIRASMDTYVDSTGHFPNGYEEAGIGSGYFNYVGFYPGYGSAVSAMKFDVSGLTGSISSVMLNLYITDNEGFTPPFVTVSGSSDNSWPEDTAAIPPIGETLISMDSDLPAGQWKSFDVTNYVKAHAADGAVTFVLTGPNAGVESQIAYASDEDAVNYPRLVVSLSNPPTDIALNSSVVAENAPAGTEVGTLSATDADSGDSFTYSLVGGTGDSDNASFAISGDKLKTAASFDYETKNSYSVRVQVTDSAGGTFQKAFAIGVGNVNEAPTDIALSASSVAENAPVGTEVGTLSASDPDNGDSFTYELASGAGDDDNASFTIDGAALKTTESFDYETKSDYSIRVRVTDAAGGTFEKAFAVTVTDVDEAIPPVTEPVMAVIYGTPQHVADAETVTEDGVSTTTITFDRQQLQTALASRSTTAGIITMSAEQGSDNLIIKLDGSAVQSLENKKAVFELRTEQAVYTLPVWQTGVAALQSRLGASHLADIEVQIRMVALSAAGSDIEFRQESNGKYTIVVPPMEFKMVGSYNGSTAEVPAFNTFMLRKLIVPDGVDPAKITASVVMKPDGTSASVPPVVVRQNGIYYALLSLLGV